MWMEGSFSEKRGRFRQHMRIWFTELKVLIELIKSLLIIDAYSEFEPKHLRIASNI